MVVQSNMIESGYNPSNFIDFVNGNRTCIVCKLGSVYELQLTIENNNVQLYLGDNVTVYIYGIK